MCRAYCTILWIKETANTTRINKTVVYVIVTKHCLLQIYYYLKSKILIFWHFLGLIFKIKVRIVLHDLWRVCYIQWEEMLRYLVRNRDLKPKSISWTYVLNLDLCNHEKKSHNWKEHHPDHPYTISSVLHVDGQLYFILSFTEFTGLVFALITTLLSG